MILEQEAIKNPTPLERLRDILDGEKSRGSRKEIRLANNVFVAWRMKKDSSRTGDEYSITVKEDRIGWIQAITFSINASGIESLKVPDLGIGIGNVQVLRKCGLRENFEDYPLNRKTAMAEHLVNWIDNIVRDKRYFPPPISTRI